MDSDKGNLHTKTQRVWRQRLVRRAGPPKICLNLFIHSLLPVGWRFFKWPPHFIPFSKLEAIEACARVDQHLHVIHWLKLHTENERKNLKVSKFG